MSAYTGQLSPEQLAVVEAPLEAKIFLRGPAGSGKTTAGVERVLFLLGAGVPGTEILLLVPQRTLAAPYYQALRQPGVIPSGAVSVLTIGGLAKRMVELFWPLIADQAGFAHPHRPPTFLTLETAQYYMAHITRPLLDQGYFEGVTVEPNRLYSQILDNLNKAAAVGFPHTEISKRLKSAWSGDPGQAHIYDDAQQCAALFRQYCLQHNLLDFSLQLQVFHQVLWPQTLCRDHLLEGYHHLVVDNLEEDVPVTHDLLSEWLSEFDSALLIFDQDAGYRRFLGADPQTTASLEEHCHHTVLFSQSFVSSQPLQAFSAAVAYAFTPPEQAEGQPEAIREAALALRLPDGKPRYYPQMLDWVCDQIEAEIQEGTPPGEIVVLAPYLSDALRFALTVRLADRDIPAYSHRPSRPLQDEPAARALLTLAALAHPQWGIKPARFDLAYAFIQSIAEMDLVRAKLLAQVVYKPNQEALSSFDQINTATAERVTYVLGGRYQALRDWLDRYRQGDPEELDYFFSRLFGEVLSQPGFGFHGDYDAGEVTARLIESVRKFRWAVGENLAGEQIPLGKEYLHMVADGVIAAQYIFSWDAQPEEAVFLAPAYTFLMRNRPVDIQFWLDIGARGWYERIRQPLTHPYVLSRQWEIGRPWTDGDEFDASREALYNLTQGLVRRCRAGIYLGISDLSEQGYEHKGLLLKAIDRALRAASRSQ
jgi:hypothetical protein